jgi:hypothetical protein
MKRHLPVTKIHKITCPSCQTINEQSAIFCRKCGAPIGAGATLDPIQTIQAEGHLLRRATEGRPRPIVLLGMWIIFLPVLAFGVYFAIYLILNRSGFSDFFFFWGAIGLAYIGFKILYRTTKNYLTLSKGTL